MTATVRQPPSVVGLAAPGALSPENPAVAFRLKPKRLHQPKGASPV